MHVLRLKSGRGASYDVLCHREGMLSVMRDRKGAPNWRMRVLALVLCLLLAGPLTALLWSAALRVIGAAI